MQHGYKKLGWSWSSCADICKTKYLEIIKERQHASFIEWHQKTGYGKLINAKSNEVTVYQHELLVYESDY